MRILFTGASSFTGCWFVNELVQAGHSVDTTFTRSLADYAGVRRERVERVADQSQATWNCRFGDERFLKLIADTKPDLLCHHAAEVTDYKSADFDFVRALGDNTNQLPQVLRQLTRVGCQRVVITGSVFEAGEGAGSEPVLSFSPYGLSKSLTDQVFRHFALLNDFSLGKFVIPNPFGPLEDPRFTAYLIRCWQSGEVAEVRTPDYVRDNIHVALLAKAYGKFVEQLPAKPGFVKTNPSGYVESQGAFATRFADEMRKRSSWSCDLKLARQKEFSEPRVRINTTPLDSVAYGWSETAAWDAVAEYYVSAGGGEAE